MATTPLFFSPSLLFGFLVLIWLLCCGGLERGESVNVFLCEYSNERLLQESRLTEQDLALFPP